MNSLNSNFIPQHQHFASPHVQPKFTPSSSAQPMSFNSANGIPNQGTYRSRPLLYPEKHGNFDILYSEEGDGEILVETCPVEEGGQLKLITCVDISTLYKEKRIKAIEIAKEYQKLQHPNLLCVTSDFELHNNNGTLIFRTEAPDHIAGWKSYCKKKFTTDEMLCIFRQLCQALDYVHEQGRLIHRDIHPTRIHSTFGLAKLNLIGMPYNYKKLLKKDNFCGHVNYSAPELIQEKLQFTSKVDIWSLGCCLYYLCTKRDPFEGRNPQEIKQNIMYGRLEKYPTKFDPILLTLINKCLEKDEQKRLNAREMLDFMDKVEIETYGEPRSQRLLQQIFDKYNSICANPLVHSVKELGDKPGSKAQFDNQRYNNPHFFMPNWPINTFTTMSTEEQDNPGQPSHQSPNNVASGSYYQANSFKRGPPQTYQRQTYQMDDYSNQYSERNSSSAKKQAAVVGTFQQNYRQYMRTNEDQTNSLGNYARQSVKQNLQNNFTSHQHPGTSKYYRLYQPLNGTDSNLSTQQSSQQQQMSHQPNSQSVQPQQIILPKHVAIQKEIKHHYDELDPLRQASQPHENELRVKQTNNPTQHVSENSLQRFNLTQINLDRFNSQNEMQQNANQELTDTKPAPKNSNLNSNEFGMRNSHDDKDEEEKSADGLPFSIFNTEYIFEQSSTKEEENEECKNKQQLSDFNNSKEAPVSSLPNNDPSSGESRNELNKDEIEGIVAQIVETSKLVKNQLHYSDGTKYVGEVVRQGRGIYYDQDGSIYDGEWFEDQRSGRGKMLFQDGSVYDGQWQQNKIHGNGVYLSTNGDRYEGMFNLGMKEGFGTIFYKNGNSYQGQWKGDQLWGNGVFHFKNGNYYEGNFVNGNFEGQGLIFFVGIGTYKGSFRFGGNLDGIGRFEYLNGAVYEGEWKENKKHGSGKFVEAEGGIHYGHWENDLKHGKGKFLESMFMIEGRWDKGILVEMTKFQEYQCTKD